MGLKYRNISSPSFSALDFEKYPPSIANLPAALTINGQTVYPTLRYKGGDATSTLWRPWGYGENLTLQAGTAPTYNNGSPLLGAIDDSVRFNAGGYYQAGNGTFGDIGTEDFVLEAVVQLGATAKTVLSKMTTAAPFTGYYLFVANGGATIQLSTYIGNVNVANVVSAAMPLASVCHVMFFWDRSGSGQCYINGAASGSAVSLSAATGSFSHAGPFFIGNNSVILAQQFDGSVYHSAIWQKASWLDTHLQATVAATRFAQLNGTYPQSARGTYLPTAVTRSSAGYLDKVEADGTSKIYYMGANWPRVCSRKDNLGTIRKGYLSETSAQNICLQSQTFATTWTTAYASVPTTSVLCPDGVTRTTCTLHEDGTATQAHHLKSGSTAPTAGVTYVFSCFAKAVNRSWVRFSYGSFVVNFNVSTGVLGTQTNATGIIQNYGNGWYRCSAVFTGAGAGYFYIELGEADNDVSFSGLDQDSIYVFGAQVETGNYPSSYIPTTSAAVTRSADLLRYSMAYTNTCLQSQTFATTWGPVRATVPTTSVLCPDDVTRTTNTLHEDNSAATSHYLAAAATVTSAAWVFSIYAKAANRSWIGLITNNGAIGAYFNISTGVAGTQTGNASGIESVGNGWYRCWFAFTATAGTASYIYIAEANADITFSGLDQDSFYLFGAQMELGNYPTSYIPTTTTAASVSNGNMSAVRGSLECQVLCPNIDNTKGPYYWQISDGTATNRLFVNAAAAGDDFATFLIANSGTQAQITGTSDVWNNGWNKLRGIWGPNDARMLVNSVSEGTPDISVTVPTGLTQLDVGAYLSAGYELGGLLANLKIYGLNRLIR